MINNQNSKRAVWGLLVLMLLMAALIFLVNRSAKTEISEDPMVQGIVARWNAGLPDGFTKESAEHIENNSGYLFAKLTYEKNVAGLFSQWKAPDSTFVQRFDAIVDEQLKDAATTQQEAEMIRKNRPVPDEKWLSYVLENEEKPDAVLMLCYEKETRSLYLAEKQ